MCELKVKIKMTIDIFKDIFDPTASSGHVHLIVVNSVYTFSLLNNLQTDEIKVILNQSLERSGNFGTAKLTK